MAIEIGKNTCKIEERYFEPVKVEGETYGKEIIFHNGEEKIKFSSEFHKARYLSYDSIDSITIKEVNKKKWFIIAALLCFVVIGVPLIFAVIHLPKWVIRLKLKKQISKKEKVLIRVRLENYDPQQLKDFFSGKIDCKIDLNG